MINIRKLAALDLAFLGPWVILGEFSVGVFGSLCLGLLTFVRTHSLGGNLLGAYLTCLGINYIPLLLHAISLVRRGTASQEIADETQEKRAMFRKYRRQSFLLLLPLVIPIAAIRQELSSRKPNQV